MLKSAVNSHAAIGILNTNFMKTNLTPATALATTGSCNGFYRKSSFLAIACVGLSLCVGMPAMAASLASFIGDVDGNSVTATASDALSYAMPVRMVDGSAMSDSPVLKSSTNTNNWWTGSFLAPQSDNNEGWLLFTFAHNTSLQEIVIWNLLSTETSAAYGRGMKAVTITCSTGSDASGTGNTILFSGDLNQAKWETGYGYTDDFTFPNVQNVKAVKFDYTSNYGGDYTGLSEVRFVAGTSAVPEPSALIAFGGLGLACLMLRRRAA